METFYSGQPSTPQIPEEEQAGDLRSRSRIPMSEAEKKEKRRRAAAEKRARETPEQTERRRLQIAKRTATRRANETPQETENRNRQDAQRKLAKRANETPQETRDRNLEQRAARNAKKSHVKLKDAMRTTEILEGEFRVKVLHETEDRIGLMTIECQKCGALKFPRETPSSCCQDGKVDLPHYPRPPEQLMQLWTGNDERSKVMRQFSRTLNNAVCLTSLQNHAPRREGWRPSVIFQGRVVTRAGPLLPGDGEQPQYSQLYVHDATLETTYRYNNMSIPDNTSEQEKIIHREILEIIQTTLHDVNPFVQDFRQIIEMIDDLSF